MDRCETEPSEGRDSSDSDGPFNEQEQNMRTKRMTMRLRHTMTLQKLQSTDLFAVKKTEHPDRKRTGEPQRKTDVPNPAPFDPEAGPTEVKPHLKVSSRVSSTKFPLTSQRFRKECHNELSHFVSQHEIGSPMNSEGRTQDINCICNVLLAYFNCRERGPQDP